MLVQAPNKKYIGIMLGKVFTQVIILADKIGLGGADFRFFVVLFTIYLYMDNS